MKTFRAGDLVQYKSRKSRARFHPGCVRGYVPTANGVDGAYLDIPCDAYVSVDFTDNEAGGTENHWPRPDEIEHIPNA